MQPTSIAIKRVVWREGILLRPQHLQQQQLHFEAQAHLRAALTCPYSWGLGSMDVDEDRLARGDFCLRFITAIFPDGLLVRVGPDQSETTQRSILAHFDRGQKELLVYLAVPQDGPKQQIANATTPDAWATRYESATFDVFDSTAPGQSAKIELAWPKVSILLGQEGQDRANLIPIARVIRQDKGYGLDPTFIPPSLSIHTSAGLELALRALLIKAHERRESLKRALSTRDLKHFGFEPQDLQRYLWLNSLSGAVATLEAMLHSQETSPYNLFLELTRWLGQLAALQKTASPITPHSYVHVKAHASFEPLFDRLFDLLDQCLINDYRVFELKRRSDGMWLAKLEALPLDESQRFVLAVQSDQGYELTAKRLPALAKVASYAQISKVIHQAVSGALISYIPRPPSWVPLHADWIYFSIHQDNPYWSDIVASRSLAFYAGHPFCGEDIRVQIYSKPPKTQSHFRLASAL